MDKRTLHRITAKLTAAIGSIRHNRHTVLYAAVFLVAPLNITKRLHFLADRTHPYVHGIYSNYLYPTLSVLDIVIFAVLIAAVIDDRKSLTKLFRENRFLQILTAYLLIHTMVFHNIIAALWCFRFFTYMTSALLLNTWLLGNKINLKPILRIIILSGIFQIAVAALQVHNGHSIGLHSIGESMVQVGGFKSSSKMIWDSFRLRAYGTFPHPNLLAGYTIFATYILAVLLTPTCNKPVTSNPPRKFLVFRLTTLSEIKVWRLIEVGSLCVVLGLTASYSGILALLSAFLIFSAFTVLLSSQGTSKKSRRGWPIAGVLLIGALLSFSRSLTNLISSAIHTQLQSEHVVLRLEYIHVALQILQAHPWVGIGAGNFVRVYEYVQAPLTAHGVSGIQPVHNIYLLVAAEHGIPATLVAMSYLIYLLIKLIRHKQYLYVAIFASIFGVIGNIDHYLLTLPQGIFITSWLISYAIVLRDSHVAAKDDTGD